MEPPQNDASSVVHHQHRSGLLCLAFGAVTLLVGSYGTISFLAGSPARNSSDVMLSTLVLAVVTLLIGHGSRQHLTGPAPVIPNRARSLGLVFAYIMLAALLAGFALDQLISAAFHYALRDF